MAAMPMRGALTITSSRPYELVMEHTCSDSQEADQHAEQLVDAGRCDLTMAAYRTASTWTWLTTQEAAATGQGTSSAGARRNCRDDHDSYCDKSVQENGLQLEGSASHRPLCPTAL